MLNYILYRIGQFIALHLPLGISYKIAALVSKLRYMFMRKDRMAVRENLKSIFPEKADKEIRAISWRMANNFAKYLVDFFRFELIDTEYIKKFIRINNRHYLDQAIAKGKGTIILTAHIGNWELGGVVVALLGYPFWAVALPHKNKKEDDFFNAQRASKGVKVIPLGRAVKACLEVLKKNEIVALVGDRDFTEKGVVLDFFGKPAFFPEGAAAFSLKTGAAIVPGFMLRNPDDTFTLEIEQPLEYTPYGDRDRDIKEIILKYKAIFERRIRQYPDQWYMFRKFWITI